MKNYDFRLIYSGFNKRAHIVKNVLTIIALVLLSLLLLMYILGFRTFAINGWSAEPYHHYGSLAIDYKVPFKDLKVGDFVTWSRSGNSYVTHQIISIDSENRTVVTCQQPAFDPDTNNDGNIKYEQIKGKVLFSIPKVGEFMIGVKSLIISNGLGFKLNIIGIMFIFSLFICFSQFKSFLEGDIVKIQGGKCGQKKK